MSSPDLHMVQMRVDVKALLRRGRAGKLPLKHVDMGYLIHCHLTDLFGDRAPQPFHFELDPAGREGVVLGYAACSASELTEAADVSAPPDAHQAVDWARIASKVMLAQFEAGRRLGFEVRVCPVVRRSKPGPGGRSERPEVDAFLSAAWNSEPDEPIDREDVYSRWLARRLEGAAILEDVQLDGWQRVSLLRRTQGADRKGRYLERPDALLRGVLQVQDTGRFAELLGKGVGRHRAFGFGMLRLRAC